MLAGLSSKGKDEAYKEYKFPRRCKNLYTPQEKGCETRQIDWRPDSEKT